MWRNHFGRRVGPVVRQNTERMKDINHIWHEANHVVVLYVDIIVLEKHNVSHLQGGQFLPKPDYKV